MKFTDRNKILGSQWYNFKKSVHSVRTENTYKHRLIQGMKVRKLGKKVLLQGSLIFYYKYIFTILIL